MLISASDPSFPFSCAACLKFQSMPEGTWYCSSCSDGSVSSKKATGTGPSGNSKPILIRLSRVVKAPESEIGGCVFCRFVAYLYFPLYMLCFCGGCCLRCSLSFIVDRSHDFSIGRFDERTVILCDQVTLLIFFIQTLTITSLAFSDCAIHFF